jgi:hypothetical protein
MNKTFLISGIIALSLGIILTFFGAIMKLEHWPGSKVVLTSSIIASSIGIILLTTSIVKRIMQKELL